MPAPGARWWWRGCSDPAQGERPGAVTELRGANEKGRTAMLSGPFLRLLHLRLLQAANGASAAYQRRRPAMPPNSALSRSAVSPCTNSTRMPKLSASGKM